MPKLSWNGDDFRNPQDNSGTVADTISRNGNLQQGYKHGSLTEGLVAYYPMDSGSGSTVTDKALNNDGTLKPGSSGTKTTSGMWSTDSKIGSNCLKFDGEDDNVDITDSSLKFSDSDSLTISAWVKISDNKNEYRHFIAFGDDDGTPRTHLSKARSGWKSGRLYFQVVNSSNRTDLLSNQDGSQLPKDQWLHLVGVVDQDHVKMRFFVNGSLQDSGSAVNYYFSQSNNFSVYIGRGTSENSSHNSVIDDVRIYNRPLSTPEIKALYNLERPSKVSSQDTLQ